MRSMSPVAQAFKQLAPVGEAPIEAADANDSCVRRPTLGTHGRLTLRTVNASSTPSFNAEHGHSIWHI
jgi:hypothetical protein